MSREKVKQTRSVCVSSKICRLFKTYFVVSDFLARADKLQHKLKGGGKSHIEEDTSDLVLVN